MGLNVIILAAGEGRRMRSRQPKVLADLAGRSLLAHVVERARDFAPERVRVVVGHGAERVRATLPEDIEPIEQAEQRGTGDAVACALGGLAADDLVVVLYGDVPLVQAPTLAALADAAGDADCALLSVETDQPAGYGRIVRDAAGAIERIVEDDDASPAERAIGEINTGLLAMHAGPLGAHVAALDSDNAQREYYLTDVIARVRQAGGRVGSVQPDYAWEVQGVNSRAQLAALERAWQRHLAERLMDAGAALRDAARIDVRGQLTTEPDALIDVGCVFEGTVHLGEGVEIGPNCLIRNTVIAAGTRIDANTVIEDGDIGRNCELGPFARLRPGVRMAEGAKVGNFVESKNAVLGSGSKVNHLAYVGDSDVGRDVNIGAGSITCNYDGRNKHRTVIEDGAFIGSDCQLVAPVRVGAGAWIGAGSTITQDAPAGQLTVSRARQKSIPGWKHPADREGD